MKIKPYFFILLFFCITSCGVNYNHNYNAGNLSVKYLAQKRSLWCWAACSEMVMRYIDNRTSGNTMYNQCEQAFRSMSDDDHCDRHGEACCERDRPCFPCNTTCNHTNWPIFEMCNFSCKDSYTSNEVFSWKMMLKEIDSNRPICITYNWYGGGAHMLVMSGYKIINNQLFDKIMDPLVQFATINNMPYDIGQATPVQFLKHEIVRNEKYNHTLGRCYYNIHKNN
ncbi:MAG: C39 family peptidase [Saprospiraceae bacterium]|nr:C39 family peptidase [Saprospiraceae bacterium]